jgi:hypothetical protein
MIQNVIAEVEQTGFVYIENETLNQPYTGAHDYFFGSTWWYRFFDYT